MWQKLKNLYHLVQAYIAAMLYGFPSSKLVVIGVTGTDGKTTTASMIYNALADLGQKAAVVTSVDAKIGNTTYDTGLHTTTPSPWQVQKFMKEAVKKGAKFFVLEATSHGLDQNRLAFINFYLAVMTNITHEHLDYHKTIQNYMLAKAKLFKNVKYSVLNLDDSSFKQMLSLAGGKIISYSQNSNAADLCNKKISLNLKIKGQYNIQNAMAACTAVKTLGFQIKDIKKSLNNFKGVKGRLEKINLGQDFTVVVDFAHTPNSLKNVLSNLKSDLPAKNNRLIAVFGAAGQRDKSKRPLMGEIAANLADITVFTSEDPRGEDPVKIADELAAGFKKLKRKKGKDYFIKLDRQNAIEFAVSLAKPGDIIGFFGKGHEQSMNIDGSEVPWNEIGRVENAIKRIVIHG